MKRSKPLIFLDIDGVLNTVGYPIPTEEDPPEDYTPEGLSKTRASRLNDLDGYIVVTSSWRIVVSYHKICFALKDAGVTLPVLGVTPYLGNREEEILYWTKDNLPETTLKRLPIVVVDDDHEYEALRPCLTLVYGRRGLTTDDVQHARRTARPLSEVLNVGPCASQPGSRDEFRSRASCCLD